MASYLIKDAAILVVTPYLIRNMENMLKQKLMSAKTTENPNINLD